MKIFGFNITKERKPKPGDEDYYGKLPNGGTKVNYTDKPLPSPPPPQPNNTKSLVESTKYKLPGTKPPHPPVQPKPSRISLSEKEPPKPTPSTEEIWCVKWNQRYGRGRDDYKAITQLFISEAEAKKFERSLKHANELLGHTSDELTWTKCEKIKDNRL